MALGAAALSARELVVGEVLGQLVAVHASAFGDNHRSTTSGSSGAAIADAFLRRYDLGVSLLRAAGLVAPASLDTAAGSGHLYAAACRFRALAQPAAQARAAAAAGVDMQAACVEEAVLVQAPVLALRARLLQLLDEWPEHPGLLQVWGGGRLEGGGMEGECGEAGGLGQSLPVVIHPSTAHPLVLNSLPPSTPLPPPAVRRDRPPAEPARQRPPQGGADRLRAAAGQGAAVGGDSSAPRQPGPTAGPAVRLGHALAPPGAGRLAAAAGRDAGACSGGGAPGVCQRTYIWRGQGAQAGLRRSCLSGVQSCCVNQVADWRTRSPPPWCRPGSISTASC